MDRDLMGFDEELRREYREVFDERGYYRTDRYPAAARIFNFFLGLGEKLHRYSVKAEEGMFSD